MKRGAFITFEGIEGSGKSTQLTLLASWLRASGHSVTETREPGGTPLGLAVRKLLLDPEGRVSSEAEVFLYLADRAQNVRENIVPALERGDLVLSDRHGDATLVYQGRMRGLGMERLREWNRVATGGLVPDRTLLFDLPAIEGLTRAARRRGQTGQGGDRIEDEPLAFHEGIRQAYLELAASEPARFLVFDASAPVEAVHATVIRDLDRWIREVTGMPAVEPPVGRSGEVA